MRKEASVRLVDQSLMNLAFSAVAGADHATEKRAFVPPDMAAGGMQAPGGMPAPGGGGGGAPQGAGGPPGGDPSGGGNPGGGLDAGTLRQIITDVMTQQMGQMGQMGAGGAGAGPGLKPKIDVNVEIMQIKNMLAKIADAIGVPIPAQDMVATPEKLQAMAAGQGAAAAAPGGQAGAAGGAGGTGAGASAIQPIDPMPAAFPQAPGGKSAFDQGEAFDAGRFGETTQSATSLIAMFSRRTAGS